MPNISTFQAPNLTLQPTETGIEATARSAQRINMYGNQEAQDLTQVGERIGRGVISVGDAAVQYAEHREISTIAKNSSVIRLGFEKQLADALKSPTFDPDDPSFAQKFLEENVNQTLDQFQETPLTTGGQRFAQQEADHLRTAMATQVHAAVSSMAGTAVKNNAIETANNSAASAFINPASAVDLMASYDRALHAKASTSPNLDAEGYARVMSEAGEAGKRQIAQAAIQGTIMNGGDWRKLAANPKVAPFVNQAETMQFVRQEQMYQRMAEGEARNKRVMKDYVNRQNFNVAADQLELSTLPQKAGDQPVLPENYWDEVRKIGIQPGVDPARLESLITKGQQITTRLGKPEPLAGISHATTMQILGDMRSGKMTNTDAIYQAYGENKLTNADFNFLSTQFYQNKTPEGERLDKDRDLFFKRYQFSFDPEGGMGSGTRQPLYEAEMAARQKEIEVRAKGEDPHSVYDPSSPNFFGKPENIQKYRQPLQQQLAKGPEVGAVLKGYRFLGGDPSKPESWAKVQ